MPPSFSERKVCALNSKVSMHQIEVMEAVFVDNVSRGHKIVYYKNSFLSSPFLFVFDHFLIQCIWKIW